MTQGTISRTDVLQVVQNARERGVVDLREILAEIRTLPATPVDEYTTFLESEAAKTRTGRCPNCESVLRPLHCCACEGCEGCKERNATPASPAAPVLHCSCGVACTPEEYEAHRAMGHDAPAALGDEAEQCSATCADFSMHLCGTAHRCVLDAGHPFDPYHGGGIHEFETHPTIVRPRKPAATTPPSIRAKAAAEEIANWLNWKGDVHPAAHQQNIVSITAIIERCLAGGETAR